MLALTVVRPREGPRPRQSLRSRLRLRAAPVAEPLVVLLPATSRGRCARRLVRVPLLARGGFVVRARGRRRSPRPSGASTPAAILRETGDLLVWQPGPFGFRDELAKTGLSVSSCSRRSTLLTSAYLLFRPLAAPRDLPGRRAAARGGGARPRGTARDTLSFFKLRGDKHYLFDAERTAFVGYRVENGVMVISGDPVGDAAAVAELMRDGRRRLPRARSCGSPRSASAPPAARSSSRPGCARSTSATRRSSRPHQFSTRGPRRSARCASRSPAREGGLRRELTELGALDDATSPSSRRIASDWRRGAPRARLQHGDGLAAQPALRRDARPPRDSTRPDDRRASCISSRPTGEAPSRCRSCVGDRDAPNGLTEFMIVKAIEELRARGIAGGVPELRGLRTPASRARRRCSSGWPDG